MPPEDTEPADRAAPAWPPPIEVPTAPFHAITTAATANWPLLAPLRPAMAELWKAWQYAQSPPRDPWEFAVEIKRLKEHSLTETDFRWLVAQGYLEHAREITTPEDRHRRFRRAAALHFSRRTCFILTPSGAILARTFFQADLPATQPAPTFPSTVPSPTPAPPVIEPDTGEAPENIHSPNPSPVINLLAATIPRNGNGKGNVDGMKSDHSSSPLPTPHSPLTTSSPLTPHYDNQRHQLRLNGHLVKEFKAPAINQELVLAAFQEEGWPPRIDDPLPPAPEQDPKRRLHDTNKCLNRHHKHAAIHFRGDGTGEGVVWEFTGEEDHGTMEDVDDAGAIADR